MRFQLILPLVFSLCTVWVAAAPAPTSSPVDAPAPQPSTPEAEVTGQSANPAPSSKLSAEEAFRAGIEAFQKKNLVAAQTNFTLAETQAENLNAVNIPALYNLGLVESREGHHGVALALWRKALVFSPAYAPAERAIDATIPKLERAELPHEVELWETFRKDVLTKFSTDNAILASLLFVFGVGWFLFRYLGRRRTARLDEQSMPGYPYVLTLCALLLICSVALGISKAIDAETLRGTIVEKKIEARSSPDSSATPLFELFEGLEVIVRQSNNAWVQVTYPGGSTGWIPKQNLFTVNDRVESFTTVTPKAPK